MTRLAQRPRANHRGSDSLSTTTEHPKDWHGDQVRSILPTLSVDIPHAPDYPSGRALKCPDCGHTSRHGKARDAATGACRGLQACAKRRAELHGWEQAALDAERGQPRPQIAPDSRTATQDGRSGPFWAHVPLAAPDGATAAKSPSPAGVA